jgi:hypothetical protein
MLFIKMALSRLFILSALQILREKVPLSQPASVKAAFDAWSERKNIKERGQKIEKSIEDEKTLP